MEKRKMLKLLKRFRGGSTWICGELKVPRYTLSHWLHGRKPNPMLDTFVPPLIEQIVATGGACIFDVDGKSVRSEMRKLRKGK